MSRGRPVMPMALTSPWSLSFCKAGMVSVTICKEEHTMFLSAADADQAMLHEGLVSKDNCGYFVLQYSDSRLQ